MSEVDLPLINLPRVQPVAARRRICRSLCGGIQGATSREIWTKEE
jgi:hypothetical protein